MDDKKMGDEHGEGCSCGSAKDMSAQKDDKEMSSKREDKLEGPNLGDASESDNESQDKGKVYNV
jgi:hypothetical protein